jgi:hypothetical protein
MPIELESQGRNNFFSWAGSFGKPENRDRPEWRFLLEVFLKNLSKVFAGGFGG